MIPTPDLRTGHISTMCDHNARELLHSAEINLFTKLMAQLKMYWEACRWQEPRG